MRFGAFQFAAGDSLPANLAAIERGMRLAAARGVRFLLTQECALTGYPPVEVPCVDEIDFVRVSDALEQCQCLSTQLGMYVAIGSVLAHEGKRLNAMVLISPDPGERQVYGKRALWGWDIDNFVPGDGGGVFTIDGLRIGIRICYEVRFPEYFRELFRERVDVALVSYNDVAKVKDDTRWEIIRAHMITRAVENVCWLISANSTSGVQTAPTCVVSPDGRVMAVAPAGEEHLLVFDCEREASSFGAQGRIAISSKLLSM